MQSAPPKFVGWDQRNAGPQIGGPALATIGEASRRLRSNVVLYDTDSAGKRELVPPYDSFRSGCKLFEEINRVVVEPHGA